MIVSKQDNPEESFRNFITFSESGMGFEGAQEVRLWEIIQGFGQEHNHMPTADSLRNLLNKGVDTDTVDFLEILLRSADEPIYKGDFLVLLEEVSLERKTRQVKDLLTQSGAILNTGMEVRDGRERRMLKGPIDAAQHFYDHVPDVVAPTTGGKINGEILHDMERGIKDYLTVKADPRAGIGQFTGITQLDEVLKGAKRHELWTHAAFTGHGKSLFARNWAYNQAIFMGYNVLYLSLEMHYKQVRSHLYSMHSAHSKFNEIRVELGVQKDPHTTIGIPYGSIVEGRLNSAQEVFLLQHVIPDLENCPDYGKIFLEAGDPDKDEMGVSDLRARAEVIDRKNPLDLIIVDHALLMSPKRRTKSTTEDLNQVIRDLKKMSMSFSRGRGIAVVSLFQISREGFKHAEKAGGMYNLTHLSYANECCVAGTPVATGRGWVPIEEVKVGDKVWSSTGWRDVLDFFDQGVRPTVKVETSNGSFTVTPDHLLRVWDEETKSLGWVAAKSLTEGSMIPTPLDYPGAENGTPSEAYLQGVGICKSQPLQSLFLYGHDGLKRGIRRSCTALWGADSLNQANYTPVKRTSTLHKEIVDQFNPNTLSRESVLCFLRGALDAGGSVGKDGAVYIATHSPESVRVIRFLMHTIGVSSRGMHGNLIGVFHRSDVEILARVAGFSHSPTFRDASDSTVETDWTFLGENGDEITRSALIARSTLEPSLQPLTTFTISEVLSVTPQEELPVYDIEVSGDHEYQTAYHLAHNCERSSDIVTASWLDDELKSKGRIQFQCLKVRDGKSFDPFLSHIEWMVNRIKTINEVPLSSDQRKALGDEIDQETVDLL